MNNDVTDTGGDFFVDREVEFPHQDASGELYMATGKLKNIVGKVAVIDCGRGWFFRVDVTKIKYT